MTLGYALSPGLRGALLGADLPSVLLGGAVASLLTSVLFGVVRLHARQHRRVTV